MAAWSTHRARLEEEMARRQEASRYGRPGARAAVATPPGNGAPLVDPHPLPCVEDSLSAYAGLTEQHTARLAMPSPALSLGTGGAGPGVGGGAAISRGAASQEPPAFQVAPGLVPSQGIAAAAAAERAAACGAFEVEAAAVAARAEAQGVPGSRLPQTHVRRALEPVPDRPFLQVSAASERVLWLALPHLGALPAWALSSVCQPCHVSPPCISQCMARLPVPGDYSEPVVVAAARQLQAATLAQSAHLGAGPGLQHRITSTAASPVQRQGSLAPTDRHAMTTSGSGRRKHRSISRPESSRQ
jgi:hypothetical protein